jgi:hypothetical protein
MLNMYERNRQEAQILYGFNVIQREAIVYFRH